MSPEAPLKKPTHQRQQGAGLPIALFIVTVLSLLVLAMAGLQDSASQSVSLQIQSQRAFFAAESGAQITLARILPGTSTASEVSDKATAEGVDDWTVLFDEHGLKGCKATMETSPEVVTNGTTGTSSTLFVTVISMGSCGDPASPDYAEREIEVLVR